MNPPTQNAAGPSGTEAPPTRRAAATRLELTARGRLALVLLHLAAGAAWLSGDDSIRLAAAMLAAPVVVDLCAKLVTRPRVSVRLAPRRTIARSSFLETLRLRNESSAAPLREVRLREPRTHVLDAGGAHLPWLAPGEEITLRLAARSPRRGRVPQRAFLASTAWPLGMFRWRIAPAHPAELITEPARAPLPADVLRALAAVQAEAEHAGARVDGLEFYSLRDYRYGEDARLVHARRSAAVGSLVRKVLRGADDRRCAVVVDLRRPPGMPPTFGRRAIELHLSRAATLVDGLLARAGTFRCVLIGDETRAVDVHGEAEAREFLAWLAVARTVAFRSLGESDLTAIEDADTCFWMAAGGYAEGMPRARANIHLVGREAS